MSDCHHFPSIRSNSNEESNWQIYTKYEVTQTKQAIIQDVKIPYMNENNF